MTPVLFSLGLLVVAQDTPVSVDAGTWVLQVGGGTVGAGVAGTVAMVPFQAALLIMTASGVNIDPAENRLALGIMLTGVAAAGTGYCLGAAYTTRWIAGWRDYEGSWNRDLLYSFVGGAIFGALTGGALLVRRRVESPLLPVSMITLGLFAPAVGGTIGFNSQAGREASPVLTSGLAPARRLSIPLLYIGLK